MKSIAPTQIHDGARRIRYAKGARTFPLDAAIDSNGLVLTEWELDAADLARLWRGGTIRLWVHTGGKPLQPVYIETTEPEP